jgi:hypothetical protein
MSFIARAAGRERIDEFCRFVFKGTCLERGLPSAKEIAAIRGFAAVRRKGNQFGITPNFPLARRIHRCRMFRM